MGNREPDEDFPGSVRNPVPEMSNQDSPAADMARSMKADKDLLVEVLKNLQHLAVTGEAAAADPPARGRLQNISSAFLAVGSGGLAWARVVFVFVLTIVTHIVKMEGEIPEEHRHKVEARNKKLEDVIMKLQKGEQDVANMKDTIYRAAEDDYKLLRAEHKKLEMALATAKCVLASCQDDVADVREANSCLQLGGKDSARGDLYLLVAGTTFAAALAVAFYNWGGPLMTEGSNQLDDDDVSKMKITTTTVTIIIGGWLCMCIAAFRGKTQNLLNNKKMSAECKEFQQNDLKKVERAVNDLKRDIDVLVPQLKNKLDVMDIDVSRDAPLRRPHWE